MVKPLLELFREYIDVVNKMKPIVFKDFQVRNKMELIERKSPYNKGQFIVLSRNEYRFHGRGCHFTSADRSLVIDWDFGGLNDQWCGINPGLFCYYLNTEYKQENNPKLYNQVKVELKNLVDKKIMIEYSDLYYFVVDLTVEDVRYLRIRKRSSKHKVSAT